MATRLLGLTPEEIGDHVWVEVVIHPKLPQDDMQKMQLVEKYRAAGPGGLPILSDEDLLVQVLHHPHPQEALRRAALQWLETNDPEIVGVRTAALRASWKKDNQQMVRAFEKEQQPDVKFREMMRGLSPEDLQKLIEAAAEAKHVQMMGQDPGQMMAAAQDQAVAGQAAQMQASLAPPTAQPFQGEGPGPMPQTLPSQMGMDQAPQPMAMTPDVLAMQMRRGNPQP